MVYITHIKTGKEAGEMMDYIDEYKLNREKKLLTFVMCGDWRFKVNTIIELEELPESRIREISVKYNEATTTITFTIQ